MNMIKITTVLFLALLPFASYAGGVSCTSEDGKIVKMKSISAELLHVRGFAIALSGINEKTGERTVLYDANGLNSAPLDFKQFSLYHECAHHSLGHIRPGMRHVRAIHTRQHEKDADCYARKRLESSGGKMETVYTSLRNKSLMKSLGVQNLNAAHSRVIDIKKCK